MMSNQMFCPMLKHNSFLLAIVVLLIGNLAACSDSASGGSGSNFQTTTQVTLAPTATQPIQGSPASLTPIQALEFSMSKWQDHQRWEWALQWERAEAASQGNLPTWKLWTGKDWQSMNVPQELAAHTWHALHLQGKISNGKIYYIGFSCDDTRRAINYQFDPTSSLDPPKLAVAVSLDGNNNGDSYQVYIDDVNL